MSSGIYLSVMSVACFGVFVISLIVNRKKVKDEIATAIKQDITSKQMKEAEQVVERFLSEKNIPSGASISEVGAALNIREGETVERISGQAHLSGPNEDGIMIVTFRKGLSQQERTFAFAHECGHRINNDTVPIDRPAGKHKALAEQLADYVAAALLMPLDSVYTYLEKNHFRTASPRARIKITKSLCKIYGVDEVVALRRIREVYMVKKM